METKQQPDAGTRSALDAFRARLRRRYGDRLQGIVLFGSRARGDYRPDSDADVAVFLDSVADPVAAQMDIAEDAYRLFLQNGLLIQPWVFRGTPKNPDLSWGSGLLRAVSSEGVAV